jgi:large subunit ribosomal protein L9
VSLCLARVGQYIKMPKKKKEKMIPVLLLEDLVNLGQRGEVILVKPGYFRYLISQKKVVLATKEKLEKELKPFMLEEKIKSREKEIEKLKKEIEKLTLEFKINQYVPKITKEKIIKALKEKGINISKNQIEFEGKIEKEGEYIIKIKLGFDIVADLRVKIKNG